MQSSQYGQRGLVLKKIIYWLAGIFTVLVLAGVIFLKSMGIWGVIFPSNSHETTPPDIPALQQPALLLFTKTNSFRHVEGIEAGSRLLKDIAKKRGWSIFHTENGAVFNDKDLARFAGVIFHNASGDTLNKAQELSFQRWLEAGGGWLGTHAAGDGSHAEWAWYADNLVGVKFIAHIMDPQFQTATVNVEAVDHPAMAGLPDSWQHEEEWYSWESSPREAGFDILATIDENSYKPHFNFMGEVKDLRMGDHPVVWSRCIGKGRAIYSTMGHAAAAYDQPQHQQLLENAMAWIIGLEGASCE